jgi:hypothetical protein
MTKIIVQVEGHYEVHETPFSRAYDWYPACVILECDCGEKLALTGSSTGPACRLCGAEHSDVILDIQEREGRLQHETTHPWHYDLQSQEDQQLRDEAAYPEGSSWRYNDVTSGLDDKERWKKTKA